MSTIVSFSALFKDGHKLCKEIEPKAVMHRARDRDAMKKVVTDVKAIILRLPVPAPEIQGDFELADELVTRMFKKQRKPTLNTSDLDCR